MCGHDIRRRDIYHRPETIVRQKAIGIWFAANCRYIIVLSRGCNIVVQDVRDGTRTYARTKGSIIPCIGFILYLFIPRSSRDPHATPLDTTATGLLGFRIFIFSFLVCSFVFLLFFLTATRRTYKALSTASCQLNRNRCQENSIRKLRTIISTQYNNVRPRKVFTAPFNNYYYYGYCMIHTHTHTNIQLCIIQ